MAANKTQSTSADVEAFLSDIADVARQADCRELATLMQQVTGEAPVMWGASMVGFGRYRYQYESGRSGEWFLLGFSPRKTDLTLYLMSGFDDQSDLMANLGKYKIGKSCLYIKTLADIDLLALKPLLERSVAALAPQRLR
ncbi:MAG: hypothetical protein RLZZ537_1738 [Pseudomonadota bacterium]|jgi:hypothetical protein